MTPRHFEDFAVGQTFRSGPWRIDTKRIETFAAEFVLHPSISMRRQRAI